VARIAAACILLAVLVGMLVHTAPVRRAVLQRVVVTLADRFHLALRAETLYYNLPARRLALSGVSIAAVDAPAQPFFTADRVELTLAPAVFAGRLAIDLLRIDNARIDVRRRADGTTNLPSGAESAAGEPAALPLERLDVPQLVVTVVDEAGDVSLTLPALTLNVGRSGGAVRLTRPGRVERRGVGASIGELSGGVAFDGRALELTRLAAATPDARVAIEGTVSLLVSEPRADLRFAADGDLGALAPWFTDEAMLSGQLSLDGTIRGPLDGPAMAAHLRSESLQWRELSVTRLEADVMADPERIRMAGARGSIAGGGFGAQGDISVPTGEAALAVSWEGVDLETVARSLGSRARLRPAGRSSGAATIRTGRGDLDGWSVDARARVTASPVSRGRIPVPGAATLSISEGRWRLDAAHEVAGAPLRARLSGVLDPARFEASTLGGDVTVDETRLAPLLEALRRAGIVDVAGHSVGGGLLRADARLGGTFARPRVRIVAAAREVSAAGVNGVAADVEADGTMQQMAVRAEILQGAANRLSAAGTVFPERARLEARATAHLDDPRALVGEAPLGGTVVVELEARGPFDAVEAAGTATIRDAAYDRLRLGELTAAFKLAGDTAHVDVASGELSTRASADIGLASRTATIDVRMDRADLARMLRDVQVPLPIRGAVNLAGRATLPLNDWQAGSAWLDISAADATAGDLTLAATARASYADRTLTVERLEAGTDLVRLSVSGKLPVDEAGSVISPSEALNASISGDLADVIAAVRATGLMELPVVDGRGPLAVRAAVTGTASRPVLAADVELSNGSIMPPDLPPVRSVDLRAHLGDGWIQPLQVAAEWQSSRVEASGRIPMRLLAPYLPEHVVLALPETAAPAGLTARLTSITPAVLAPFVAADALAQIAGTIDATARLEAASLDPASLLGEVRLDRFDLRVAGLPVTQREPTVVVFENGLARVAAWDWAGQGATLGVQGQLNLADRQASILAAGRFDVRLLTPLVRGAGVTLGGTLAPRVAVFGPLSSPSIDGELALEGGELRLREPRLVATGIDAFAVLSPQRARITSLSGIVNGGALSGGGELTYTPGVPGAGQLTMAVDGMGLELPDGLRSELDADLTLAVEGDPAAGRVSGTVSVVRGAYREPLAVVAGLLNTLRAERVAAVTARSASLADRMRLDVRVVTDADIVVDNNVARLQLGGDLRVIGTAAAPAVSGRATLREGGQLFLGPNVYTIGQGTIDFDDPDTIHPDLNVEAMTRAGGHEIALTLTGPPEALDVDVRSITNPSLGQADVTSLLLVGRPLDEVSGAGAQIVGEQVLGYLSGDLLGFAGRSVGLDSIRLEGSDTGLRRDPAAVASQTDPTSRLTFGKSIGADVDLTYSQSLRDGSAQTWIVDYRPLPQVNLRLVSDDDTLRSYEFRHDVTVGGSPGTGRRIAPGAAPRRIAGITFAGDTVVPEEALRAALRQRPGGEFDFTDWQRDREALEGLLHQAGYLQARVGAARDDRAAGIALTYAVAAGPRTVIQVEGHAISADTRRSIEQAWIEAIVDDFLEEEAAAILRDSLVADGYFGSDVDVDLLVAGSDKTLRIQIEPGPRAVERRIEVLADDGSLAREVEAWIGGSGLDAWREPEALRDAIEAELQRRGHLRARATVADPRVEDRTAILSVSVEAGPVFTIASVTFPGASRITTERVREAAAIEAGARYDPADADAARARIESAYRTRGFASARVSLEAAIQGSAAVALTFRVEEGPQQVLRDVAVRGNRDIDRDVVLRALEVEIGEALPADTWLRARSRLFDTGLFRRVDVASEPMEAGDAGGERPTRLVVTVEEWPALRARYGFQLSERRPEDNVEGRDLAPGISADVTRRTLFGRAVTIGAAAEYQRRERLGRVFLNAPTLLGLRVESLLTVERSRQSFADATFITDRTGVSWEQRMRVGTALQLSYSYRFDRDHTFDTAPPDPFFPSLDITANVARLTASAVFDTRDDPADTKRGSLLSSTFEVAPHALGSDFRFVRHLGQAYHFRPVGPFVLASAARVGLAGALGGQELLLSERFFAGGALSVRGVPEESLGPRSIFGDVDGGRALMLFNQEARFPVFRWVRGAGFIDTGNVFATPADIDAGAFVTSYGIGARVATPFALLRADYARLWSSSSGLRPVRWTFGIGHVF
jgi:outer membrane protein assembly factor BamA/autotransporter translocation and assembly factor TamB